MGHFAYIQTAANKYILLTNDSCFVTKFFHDYLQENKRSKLIKTFVNLIETVALRHLNR